MSKTDYGSGISRSKIEDKDSFDLKGQFLKELRDNTFSGSDHEDANEHIKKVLEIRCKRTSRTRSTKTSDGLVAIQAQLNSLGREIKKVNEKERGFGILPGYTKANPRDHVKSISTTVEADTNLIRHMGSPQYALTHMELHISIIPYLEKRKDPWSFTLPCYINNICFDNAFADLGASVSVMPLSTYLSLGLDELAHTKLTIELADRTVKYPKGIAENILVGIGKFVFPVDFIILDILEDVKVPLILGRPFLSTAHAKIDVFKRKITLRTLVLNRSLDPLYGDYIELNDLNEPLELRRDQIDDLMPTIKEGEVIDEPMIDIIKTRKNESFDEEFYNSIMRDKVEYKGKNVAGAFINVPIFVRNFSVLTHFAVVENIDGYQDQDMGDIILGEPFYKASCVEARRFDGLITIQNGNDNVTYQIARSHPRFKHLSNSQCNKIKQLLKVSMHDKLNGISHP
ncbi:retrovirus-related pol polyprotein from transposon TNT 1-94 [Tanacetum coccineum]